jgi:hypothetical protein
MALLVKDDQRAEEVQLALLRGASVAQRFALVRRLTQQTIQLSRRAIRRANPAASQQELSLLFVELHYGKDLAARLKTYLDGRLP